MSTPLERKLLALLVSGHLRECGLYRLEIAHDDHCPKLRGGHCQCDPDLILDGKRVEVATA